MAIERVGTLVCVAAKTKRVPQSVLDSFGRALTKWVNEAHDGNQTDAGRALGFSQGHISAMMLGTRGPGLNAIIALHQKTGTSVDELLGLGPAPADKLMAQFQASLGMEVARFRADASRTLEEARVEAAKAIPARPKIPRSRRKGAQ